MSTHSITSPALIGLMWRTFNEFLDRRARKKLGIGRPYLDKDPPHVAPIDGKEYAEKRGAAKARLAE
jgi:hypothetical protein